MKKLMIIFFTLLLTFQISALEDDKNLLIREEFDSINDLNFHLYDEDVTINQLVGDKIIMEIYSNNKKKIPDYEIFNKTLTVKSKPGKKSNFDLCKIVIYIPENYRAGSLIFKSENSDVKIENFTSDIIDLTLLGGNLEVKNVNAVSMIAKNKSGTINVWNTKSEEIKLSTLNSPVEITNFIGEYVCIESESGKIDVQNISCDYFDFETVKSDIKVELQKSPLASSFIKSVNGNVELYTAKGVGFNLYAFSNSGRFNDEFDDLKFFVQEGFYKNYFEGTCDISIETSFGDITVGN